MIIIPQKDEFCNWTAACRLASKGKPISDSTYDSEIEIVKTMCNMQEHSQTLKLNRNKRTPINTDDVSSSVDLESSVNDYLFQVYICSYFLILIYYFIDPHSHSRLRQRTSYQRG